MELRIIYEDKFIIVLHKPAGIATQTKKVGEQDLFSMVKNHLSGGYVGLINRLDQPVEGIVLMAKSSGMAAKLNKQLTDDAIEKYYRATSYISNHNSGVMTDSYVRLTNYMYVDRHTNLSRLCDKSYSIAKEALLDYKMTDIRMERDYSIADLDIRLITGRHHQIRLQLSGAGMPILGDLKYGSEESMAYSASHGIHRIQLCAYKLKFSHPATDMDMLFTI